MDENDFGVGLRNVLLRRRKKRENIENVNSIVSKLIYNYTNDLIDFSSYKSMVLSCKGKKRIIYKYEKNSGEDVFVRYAKMCLDRLFSIKYPNRDNVMHRVFNEICLLPQMRGFFVYRFDFEDYYNTISTDYVYERFIKDRVKLRRNRILLENIFSSVKYCYAGIPISNALAEIVGCAFDEYIQAQLSDYGLIYYNRYVDDVIMIFNTDLPLSQCEEMVKTALLEIYRKSNISKIECKTRLNLAKKQYVRLSEIKTQNATQTIDYLGYLFKFTLHDSGLEIRYGIAKEKINKYKNRLRRIIRRAVSAHDTELLRHSIKAFCSRIVYIEERKGEERWITQGVVSTYNELRNHLKSLEPDTKQFLQNTVFDTLAQVLNGQMPYFCPSNVEHPSAYNLYDGFERNKAIIFVPRSSAGIRKDTLLKMCRQVGCGGKRFNYHELRKTYMKKIMA